jgi:hypothetical protein
MPNSTYIPIKLISHSFTFEYNERNFEFQTETKQEAEVWVNCLKMLSEHKSKEQETATSARSVSYFNNLSSNLVLMQDGGKDDNLEGELPVNEKQKKKQDKVKSKAQAHKFSNVDARAFGSVLQESNAYKKLIQLLIGPDIVINKENY